MFTSLHPDSSLKQSVTFVASLCLQFAVLLIVCDGPIRQMSGPYLRPNAVSSATVSAIYFHKDSSAAAITPEAAPPASHPAPELRSEATPGAEAEAATQAEAAGDGSGTDDGQVLAPFPSWRMNSMPNGFTVMHHQIKTALPVFTPDPPILHGEVPLLARGKDVVLNVVIDDQGAIVQVEVVKAVGYGMEDSIMLTLRRWIFVPAKVNGVAIASRRQLHFHFPG